MKKLDLLKDALAIAPDNYKDNVRIIATLDDKAQKTGTIAGVFLGVLLALVKPDQLSNLLGLIGKAGAWVVTFITIMLIVCVGLCLWCMWIRVSPPPLSVGHLTYMIESVDLSKPLDDEVYCAEKVSIWKVCIDAQGTVTTSKRKRVWWAQFTLACAMAIVAGMLVYLIHSVQPNPAPTAVSVSDC